MTEALNMEAAGKETTEINLQDVFANIIDVTRYRDDQFDHSGEHISSAVSGIGMRLEYLQKILPEYFDKKSRVSSLPALTAENLNHFSECILALKESILSLRAKKQIALSRENTLNDVDEVIAPKKGIKPIQSAPYVSVEAFAALETQCEIASTNIEAVQGAFIPESKAEIESQIGELKELRSTIGKKRKTLIRHSRTVSSMPMKATANTLIHSSYAVIVASLLTSAGALAAKIPSIAGAGITEEMVKFDEVGDSLAALKAEQESFRPIDEQLAKYGAGAHLSEVFEGSEMDKIKERIGGWLGFIDGTDVPAKVEDYTLADAVKVFNRHTLGLLFMVAKPTAFLFRTKNKAKMSDVFQILDLLATNDDLPNDVKAIDMAIDFIDEAIQHRKDVLKTMKD